MPEPPRPEPITLPRRADIILIRLATEQAFASNQGAAFNGRSGVQLGACNKMS
jgi:hypothetical protein